MSTLHETAQAVAELQTIQVRALEFPVYDNSRLTNFNHWYYDNHLKIEAWWQALRVQNPAEQMPDFWKEFVPLQHERELQRAAIARSQAASVEAL